MNQPLVSIILPVYQGESTVLKAIASVFQQTYTHLELIVIDDGCTDNTESLLAALTDPRLTVLRQENQGVAAARNFGIQHARGEYIAFLDADDRWLPNKLAKEIQTIESCNDPICLIYSGYYAVDANGHLTHFSSLNADAGLIFKQTLLHEGRLLPSTVLMHRQIVEAVGGFPSDSYHEDRVFFIKATQHYPAYPTGKRLVIYQQTLSGRCRRILSDYNQALQAEVSIVDSLKSTLNKDELALLSQIQMQNLLYRFLMYGFLEHAKKLYPSIEKSALFKSKKGYLAWLSLQTGLNFLASTRNLVQSVTRLGLTFWWKHKGMNQPLDQGFHGTGAKAG